MTYHFRLIFSNNYDGNEYNSFQGLHDPHFTKLSINFYRTYERGDVNIDITMACDISI